MVLKRIFSLLMVLSIFSYPVLAVQEKAAVHNAVIAPSWSEFCPARFVNAEYIPISDTKNYCDSYCHTKKKWVEVLSLITVLPAASCVSQQMSAYKKITEHNQNLSYWNSRKELFDSAIATCASSPVESQAACYMQVRQLELQRKQLALQSLQADIMYNQSRTQSLNNINQTIQMQNMNSNLNNINNNLNRLYYH